MTYAHLDEHFRRVGRLEEVSAIAGWDQAVNMPPAAGEARADALSELSAVIHSQVCDPRVGEWLEQAAIETELSAFARANRGEISRRYRRAVALPSALVQAAAQADTLSEFAWRNYRKENNFAAFAPSLERVLQLKREIGARLSEVLGCSPYEALAQEFEPGIRIADIEAVFHPLRAFLPSFTREVLEKQRSEAVVPLTGPFPVPQQRALGLDLMKQVGFDGARGRLDVSHHPFCGGVPDDVRITTRYDESDFTSALMGVLHETGHAKYEQGLPREYRHTPVGAARGMVIHESQSLLQEMQISRGRPFLEFALPAIRKAFPERVQATPAAFSVDNFATLYTRVKPSFIRVDADEVTYPSHILLRYDLERRLIEGTLDVKDLPEAWDAQMKHYLGISTAGNDKDGCLQDVHWPSGSFGYFPLYTLGAMVAAQLFAALRQAVPDLSGRIAHGDFAAANQWLEQKVWSRGCSVSSAEIIKDATGSELDAQYFIDHLKRRYLKGE